MKIMHLIFDFVYKGYKINMGISATGKDSQFEIGEGGIFDILFLTPNKNFLGVTFIYDLITNEENRKKIKRVLGKNKRDVEEALIILKDFLDSDNARILLESLEEE